MESAINNQIKVSYESGVKDLKIMFPTIDEEIISSILEQTGIL